MNKIIQITFAWIVWLIVNYFAWDLLGYVFDMRLSGGGLFLASILFIFVALFLTPVLGAFLLYETFNND